MIHFLLSSDETHKFMYNDVRSSERVYIGKETSYEKSSPK